MKQKKSVMYIFLQGAAALAVILMLGLFPLYFQNNFIDMSNAKLSFFRVCSIGLVLAAVLFLAMDLLSQYKEGMQAKNKKSRNKKAQAAAQAKLPKSEAFKMWLGSISVTTWFAVIFAAGVLIATIFSANPQESWHGAEGRKLGAVVWLLCIAMYGIVGKYLNAGKWTMWVFLAANILVSVFAVLNFWKIDPLGMYENLSSEQHGGFISTIGNVNACSSYLCMALPVGMVIYTTVKDLYLRIAAAVFLVLGFCACYCTHSESWMLGVAASFLVMLWFGLRGHGQMLRFLEVCEFFWAGSLLMKVMLIVGAASGPTNLMYIYLTASKLQHSVMLHGYVLAAEGILIAAALFFILNRSKSGKELPYRTIRKTLFTVLAVLAGIVLVAAIAANLNKETWEGAFSVLERLRMQDESGSGRGYIWRITMESWLQLPLWDKITGYGVNYYHMFIQQYGGAEVAEFFGGALLVDAHNELMQIISTMGLLGTVGYFGLLISTAVKSAKGVSQKPFRILGVAVVCGYMAQGLVNNPTVFLTPYLFLLLGIIKSMEKMEDAAE